MIPTQPRCGCFECNIYGLVYSSLVDVYKCLECKTMVPAKHVEGIILAYGVYKSANPPTLIPNYNAITCISCQRLGGVGFQTKLSDQVYCDLCRYAIPIYQLHDAMVNAFRTKLIEKTYHTRYAVFGSEGKR